MSKAIGGGTRPLTGPLDPALVPPKPTGSGHLAQDPTKQLLDAAKMPAGDSWRADEKLQESKRADGKHLAEQTLEATAVRVRPVGARTSGSSGTGDLQGKYRYGESDLEAVKAVGGQLEAHARSDKQLSHREMAEEKLATQRSEARAEEVQAFEIRQDGADADQAYPSKLLEGPPGTASGRKAGNAKPDRAAAGAEIERTAPGSADPAQASAAEAVDGAIPGAVATGAPTIEGQAGRFRNGPVKGDTGEASAEAEAVAPGGTGPTGMPEEAPVALPDFGPQDGPRTFNAPEAKAVKEGMGRSEAALADLADLLTQAGALPRTVGDKPLPAPQRAVLKRLAALARKHGLVGAHHVAALETAATPRLTGFLKRAEADGLRKAVAALIPALKGRIGRQQALHKQLAGFLGQVVGPKERQTALRALQSLAADATVVTRPAPEGAARSGRPVLPTVLSDAQRILAPPPIRAGATPPSPGATSPPPAAEQAEVGLQSAKREHAADRHQARRLERRQQEEQSEGRAADARDEVRHADRKRLAARLAKWIEARRAGKAPDPRAGSVASRRFRFLRDVARRGGGDPRGRQAGAERSGRSGTREAPRLQPAGGRLRAVATARLAELQRQAGLRRQIVRERARDEAEREVQRRVEGEGADRLETLRRGTQAEEGRIVEKRRLDLEEQARLDEARRRERDEHERQFQRKRWERDEHERQVQRKRQEREEFDEAYQRKKRERDEAEREDQRKRDEDDLRDRRSRARDQAARQAAGLSTDSGDVGAAEVAEFGPNRPERPD